MKLHKVPKKYNRIFRKIFKRRKLRKYKKNQIIGRSVRVVLPYAETFVRSNITGIEDYQFNLNSIYDPNLTGTGHQPLGHDQYNTFYQRYRVYKAKVTVDWTQGGGDGMVCCLAATNNTTAFTSMSAAMEQPYTKHKAFSATGGATRVSKVFNLPKVIGRPSYAYRADDRYQAQFGSSPAENCVLHVVSGDELASATFQYSFAIKILYYVELFDPVQLSQS